MTFTLGHANIQQTDPAPDERATIDVVHDHADVVTFNEARDAKATIVALPGWDSFVTGGLGIAWNTAKLQAVDHGAKVVMQGGRRGTGRKGDRRRRGPTRLVLWVVLREKATGLLAIVATHHAIAKADTTAKWRRALRSQGWAGVVSALRGVNVKYPGARRFLTGDMNARGVIAAFAGLGVREAKTPATFGRNRYDRIFSNGAVSNVRTLPTRSDHKALLATVTLSGQPVPPPKPTPAPPKPPKPPEVLVPRQARSLDVLLAEVNTHAPKRSRVSDGGLASSAHHSANPTSDHEPNAAGVWRARDVTNDPIGGMPGQQLSRLVAAKLGKHPALGSGAYVIFNHQIISANRLREGWRPYTGTNAHEHHVHVSVATLASGYDSTVAWGLFRAAEPALNHVENAHELGIQLLTELRKTKKSRTSVHRMADEVEAALAKGPAS